MKRVLSTVLLAGVLVTAGSSAAMATTYPAPPPGAAVSDGTVVAGQSVVFSGTGFTPGERVNIIATNNNPAAANSNAGNGGRAGTAVSAIIAPLETQNLSAVADAEGKFSTSVTLSEPGTYTLTATGAESGRTVTAVVTVQAEAAPVAASVGGEKNLADTGANGLLMWSAVGIAALGAGAASVIVVRRKAAAETA